MNKYDYSVRKALKLSEKEMVELCHPYVGSEHFILAILSFDNEVRTLLNKYNVSYKKYKELLIKTLGKESELKQYLIYTPLLKRIIDYDNYEYQTVITIKDTFLALLEEGEGIGITLLKKFDVNLEKLFKDLNKKNINTKQSIIFDLGINLNELSKKKELDKVVGREKEIDRLIEILARKTKNNPILIGEAGVGKTAVVEGLANKIIEGKVPTFLKDKTIISLNMSSVISGTKYRGEFEEKINKILTELENDSSLILFIDEIHTLVGAGGAEGAIDASNILKPSLARGKIRCIGATTTLEYKKFIEKDKALDRRFQKIIINETNKEETIKILTDIKNDYEDFHNVKIPNDLIIDIVDLSNKYIFDRKEPDKSIDVLDEICAKARVTIKANNYEHIKEKLKNIIKKKNEFIKSNNFKEALKLRMKENKLKSEIEKPNNIITKRILIDVIESKSNSKIDLYNKSNLLKSYLNREIIGQKEAIKVFTDNIHNASFLLSGPPGSGKTLTVKKLSEYNSANFLKINLSDYKSDASVNRIIGSPQGYVGYDDVNTIFETVKLNPKSYILLKNINKANESVLNILFNIIDEKELTTSKGEKINFSKCKFFFTDTSVIKNKRIGFNSLKETKHNTRFESKVDVLIKFNSLCKKDIIKICKNNYNLSESEIISLLNNYDYEKYGAKKLNNIFNKQYSIS